MSEALVTTLVTTLIGAAIVIIPLLISFRQTSFTELKAILDTVKEERKQEKLEYEAEIDELRSQIKDERKKREALQVAYDEMVEKQRAMERENDNYKRYIVVLLKIMQDAELSAPPM